MKILVDSRTPLNFEIVAPVVRAMAADPRVEFSFTASEEPERLAAIYRDAMPGMRIVRPLHAALRRWDAYLTSDFMWATLPRGAARVQMFHGVAGKYNFDAPTESMSAWTHLFFVNERRMRNWIAAGALDRNSAAPRLVGMPKVDCLVDGSLRQNDILGAFELDPALPTVLYAPTWSPASSLNLCGTTLIERLLSLPINLIVKLHDRSRDRRPQYSGGVDWIGSLAPLLDRPEAVFASGANIAPCLVAADVMVTDHSSAAFEYLLLDRPVVRIDIPQLVRHAHIHADYVSMLAESAVNVADANGAAAAVERALSDPGCRSATRRAVAADLFYRPGTASARAATALYDIGHLAPHASVTAALRGSDLCEPSA